MFEALNPIYWWGITAISAPIIIHLINRLRYRRVRWAAMEFLLKSQKRNRRKLILEQIILLMMRCLLVCLIALLVIRPTWLLGDAGRTADLPSYHMIILDDSLSMQDLDQPENESGSTAFQRAATDISQLALKQAEAPNNFWTIVKMSDPEAPELGKPLDQLAGAPPGTLLDVAEAGRLTSRLAALRCTYLPLHPLKAVQQAQRYLQLESAQTGHRYLHIFSDFRRRDWTETGADETCQILAELARVGKVHIRLHDKSQPARGGGNRDEAPQPHANVAILNLIAKSRPKGDSGDKSAADDAVPLRVVTPRLPFDLHAVVRNFSSNERKGLRLTVSVAGREIASRVLERLSGGEEKPVVFNLEFGEADTLGLQPIAVRLDDPEKQDYLAADNVRYTYLELRKDIPVLLIDPEHGGGMEQSSFPDSFYIANALSGTSRTGLRPERVRPSEIKGRRDLDQFPVIFILNVAGVGGGAYDLDEEGLRALEKYVFGGGSVVFFLGPRVNVFSYNEHFYKQGKGIFPVPLKVPDRSGAPAFTDEPPDEKDVAAKFRFVKSGHPAFRFQGDIGDLLSKTLTINRYFKVDPAWKPNDSVSAVMQLANRQPLVFYRKDTMELVTKLRLEGSGSGGKVKEYADKMADWLTDAEFKRGQKGPLLEALGGLLADPRLVDFWKEPKQQSLRAQAEKLHQTLLTGEPIVIEAAVGQGKVQGHVMAFLTTAGPTPISSKDYSWNNWADDLFFTYVPMVLMVYDYLAALSRPADESTINRLIGMETEVRLDKERYGSHVELWYRPEKKSQLERVDVVRAREVGKEVVLRVSPVRGPGFYLLRLNQPSPDGTSVAKGEPEDRPLAFNVDGRIEGDLKRVSEAEVQDKLAAGLQKGVLKMSQPESQAFVGARQWFVDEREAQTEEVVRNQSWSDYSWVLIVFLAVLMLEQWLAMVFSHHLKASEITAPAPARVKATV
jgi:hypothetical protein